MDFWGYPSDSCLFSFGNPKTPLQTREANNERQLIFFLSFIIYFLNLQRTANIETNNEYQITKSYFFNATVQISGQILNLLS